MGGGKGKWHYDVKLSRPAWGIRNRVLRGSLRRNVTDVKFSFSEEISDSYCSVITCVLLKIANVWNSKHWWNPKKIWFHLKHKWSSLSLSRCDRWRGSDQETSSLSYLQTLQYSLFEHRQQHLKDRGEPATQKMLNGWFVFLSRLVLVRSFHGDPAASSHCCRPLTALLKNTQYCSFSVDHSKQLVFMLQFIWSHDVSGWTLQ